MKRFAQITKGTALSRVGRNIDIRYQIAQRIHEEQGRRGWSRCRMAKQIGIPPGRLSSIYACETDVKLSTVIKMFHFLDIKVELKLEKLTR